MARQDSQNVKTWGRIRRYLTDSQTVNCKLNKFIGDEFEDGGLLCCSTE